MTAVAPISSSFSTHVLLNYRYEPIYMDDLANYSFTEPVTVYSSSDVCKRILSFMELGENWDGAGAVQPSFSVIDNAIKLLDLLPSNIVNLLDTEDVVCTPYGTIVFDFQKENRLLSIEVGEKGLGYFMEENDEYVLTKEYEPFNGIDFSDQLIEALRTLI